MIITLAAAVTAAVTGALVALLLWSRLRTLAYRQPYDDVDELGRRPTHRWVVLLVPVAWAWLTFTLAPSSWWLVLLWLPLSAALTWASAVDLDVRRLPNRVLAAAGLWTAVVLVLEAAINDRPRPLLEGAVAAATGATLFFLLHMTSRDGLGFGDVKLVAVLAGASAGTAGWPTVVALTLLGCLIALIGMAATHRSNIAFGPCIALASVITVGVAVKF